MLAAGAGRAAGAQLDLVEPDHGAAGWVQGVAHARNCGDADLKTAPGDADALVVIPPRTLADVFDELAEVSLDPQAVLDLTAARCAELVGDGCLIRLISDDGATLEPAAYGHGESDRRDFARESLERAAQRVGDGVSGKVAETGRATFVPVLPPDADFIAEPLRPYLERYGVHSLIAAPMNARGRVVGVMLVSRERESDAFTEGDAETVVRLADRAALMFDNARLFGALDRQLAEHQRADERIRFQAGLLEQIDTAVVAVDNDGRCTEFNPAAERLFGYRREEVVGTRLLGLLAAPGQEALLAEVRAAVPERGWEGESLLRRKDGGAFPGHARIAPIRDAGGQYLGTVAVVQDLTERKTVEQRLEKRAAEQAAVAALGERALEGGPLEGLLDHAMEVVAHVLGVEFAAVLELTDDERSFLLKAGIGFREGLVRNITVPADWSDSQAGFTMLAKEPVIVEDFEGERRFQAGNLLREHSAASGASVIVQGRGKPFGILGAYSRQRRAFSADDVDFLQALANVLADAIDRVRTEEDARRRGLHDPLTGLPNRTLVLDRIAHALARADRSEGSVAVLFLDVDNFKVVNDSLGHRAGDNLLRQLAARLSDAVRPADTVGRFGGDEFVVLCEDVTDEPMALRIAGRLARVFSEPFSLEGDDVHTASASIGVVLREGAQDNPEELLRDADAAMYRAKERGRSRVELFDTGMRARAIGRLQTEGDLRRALERDELRVVYQPIVALGDGRIRAFEALVRWEHPERGLLSPAQFVPVAEESGMIVALGRVVLEAACRQAAQWSALYGPVPIHVNLSARQVADPNLVDSVAHVLRVSGADPATLVLELTESSLLERVHSPGETLARLKELGISLILDDFGTGYSSLSYLQHFPLSGLKIDRSFVAALSGSNGSGAIVDAILRMARALDLEVVAEGLETTEHLDVLRRLGCRFGQGYLFSRPVDVSAASALLEAGRVGADT
ncbi:MAG: EAL domain-containing protein [Actinobacteria bacterium]|nr:MAG: EAL domain-containing protein [Actinomycetota bacterium]